MAHGANPEVATMTKMPRAWTTMPAVMSGLRPTWSERAPVPSCPSPQVAG
jgi:hypothetical protein